MDPATIYCIDTSSLIKWYVEEYPPTIFEGLQRRLEQLVAHAVVQGILRFGIERKRDATRGDDADFGRRSLLIRKTERREVLAIDAALRNSPCNTTTAGPRMGGNRRWVLICSNLARQSATVGTFGPTWATPTS